MSVSSTHVINTVDIPSTGFLAIPKAIAIDHLGNEVFELTGPPYEPWSGAKISVISDVFGHNGNGFLFSTLIYGVSGGMGSVAPYAGKFDSGGGVDEWCGTSILTGMEGAKGQGLSDNSYVLYDTFFSQAIRQGDNCFKYWSKNMGFEFHDLTVKSDDILIWAGKQGLVEMHPEGNIIQTYPNFLFEEVQTTSFDGMVGLRNDTLFLVSPVFQLMDSYGFPNGQVLDYSVGYGWISVLTKNQSVYVFNDSLVLKENFGLVEESEFQFIGNGPDRLSLAGQETYGPNMPLGGTRMPFVKDYSYTGLNFSTGRDVAVVDVQLGTATAAVPHSTYQGIFYPDAKVTVENFGSQPVDELYVRFRNPNTLEEFSQKFSGISLLPNETVTLFLDDFWLRTSVAPGGIQEICFWTSHPDFRLDANSTNDGLCLDLLVSDQEPLENFGFTVYPNPSSSGSTVDIQLPSSVEGGAVRVFNNLGVLVGTFDAGNLQSSIAMPKYPSGLYYMALEADGQVLKTLKFVQL